MLMLVGKHNTGTALGATPVDVGVRDDADTMFE